MNSMRRMFLILSLLCPVTVLASGVASAETKLAATIFSYDGADFVRTQTTLTQDGQSAVNTNLTTIVRPTRRCRKNSLIAGPRPFWAKPTKPTTHPSLVQMAN
jgi:hypothetical protein